jgi:hypothetical protein
MFETLNIKFRNFYKLGFKNDFKNLLKIALPIVIIKKKILFLIFKKLKNISTDIDKLRLGANNNYKYYILWSNRKI